MPRRYGDHRHAGVQRWADQQQPYSDKPRAKHGSAPYQWIHRLPMLGQHSVRRPYGPGAPRVAVSRLRLPIARLASQAPALGPIDIESTGCTGRLPNLGRAMAEVRKTFRKISRIAGWQPAHRRRGEAATGDGVQKKGNCACSPPARLDLFPRGRSLAIGGGSGITDALPGASCDRKVLRPTARSTANRARIMGNLR